MRVDTVTKLRFLVGMLATEVVYLVPPTILWVTAGQTSREHLSVRGFYVVWGAIGFAVMVLSLGNLLFWYLGYRKDENGEEEKA